MDYEGRISIARPPADVFAVLCDENQLTQWRDGLVAIARLDDGSDPSARRYAETLETPIGRKTVTVLSATDAARRALAFSVIDGPVRPRGIVAVGPADGGCEVTFRISNAPLLRIVTGVDRRIFAALTANVERSLARLKTIASPERSRELGSTSG